MVGVIVFIATLVIGGIVLQTRLHEQRERRERRLAEIEELRRRIDAAILQQMAARAARAVRGDGRPRISEAWWREP